MALLGLRRRAFFHKVAAGKAISQKEKGVGQVDVGEYALNQRRYTDVPGLLEKSISESVHPSPGNTILYHQGFQFHDETSCCLG
ncbi:hypothetical protein OPV22_011405 [Ensete ventricosum]|uniref:Uncharacterized protein n=1 Tax=Ensete ventricosum TaxID=4639 RepID=A0AAV8RKG0_ENSVE|nr:hypothetical protein OPV22_011405 [Ensete ventricosum]